VVFPRVNPLVEIILAISLEEIVGSTAAMLQSSPSEMTYHGVRRTYDLETRPPYAETVIDIKKIFHIGLIKSDLAAL
jgi:hypothetical protein